jgi:hypothetical protein
MISKACSAALLVGIGGITASLVMPAVMLGYCIGRCVGTDGFHRREAPALTGQGDEKSA